MWRSKIRPLLRLILFDADSKRSGRGCSRRRFTLRFGSLFSLRGIADGKRLGASTDVDELARIPFVASPIEQIRELEDIPLRSLGVTNRQIAIELGHPGAMKQAICDRLGVGVLFRSAVEEHLADGRLRIVGVKGTRM